MNQNSFISFIQTHTKLTENEIKTISDLGAELTIHKNQELLREGQTAKHFFFVISGVYRVYKIIDGKDVTSHFCYSQRNPLVASFASLLHNASSTEFIECVVAGSVMKFEYSAWKNLYSQSSNINTFARIMAEKSYLMALDRIAQLQYQQANSRYSAFMKMYPHLLNLIPHHYIASYLGITPESLSRIRKKVN